MFRRFEIIREDSAYNEVLLNLNHIVSIETNAENVVYIVVNNGDTTVEYVSAIAYEHIANEIDRLAF